MTAQVLPMALFLGIDIGTTGVRTAVIDAGQSLVSTCRVSMAVPDLLDGRPVQDPAVWWSATEACLETQMVELSAAGRSPSEIEALAVDGTSGTLLLAGAGLEPVTPGLMYNSGGFDEESVAVVAAVPPGTDSASSIAAGPSSALARLLFAQNLPGAGRAEHVMFQADWIASRLVGFGGVSDENNVLKLGYDLVCNRWPLDWFGGAGVRLELLPEVRPVGDPLGTISEEAARRFGLRRGVRVVAGTTDSNAAFIASGASRTGEGMTSLGTTLAIKLVSDRPVTSPTHGVYSHRLFGKWLAGGASNSGGGALLTHFSRRELDSLSRRINPDQDAGLDYYPLPRRGERFPVADPDLKPRVSPRPESDATFLQGLFEGIARIERNGYRSLETLGGPKVVSVRTVGGGAGNACWRRIRKRIIGCDVVSVAAEAAEGSARIALISSRNG
ncbi:MAG: FGGY-family carbohydrate kinase [Paracoccaceae bacterium]|nr:FGGY-family carbohydrate kinase [Paracoccaceae bacterium]